MLGSRELGFEIAKEYLDMPSTASISRRLKASVMQSSEELIADEAPELVVWLAAVLRHKNGCDCAELRQGYKKPLRFYDIGSLSRFCASTSAGASTARLCYVGCLSMRENVGRCTATQKKSTLWQGLDVFVLLPLNQQLLVTELETSNSKDHQSSDQTSLRTLFRKRNP